MVRRYDPAAVVALLALILLPAAVGSVVTAHAQVPRAPKLGDCLHFVLYYSEPTPDDPSVIGQHRAGFVSFVHEDGTVDLNYMTGRKPNEPDNPPDFWEHKIRRPHAWPPEPSTWHFCREEQ